MIAKVARDGLACGGRGEAKIAMIANVATDGLACGGRTHENSLIWSKAPDGLLPATWSQWPLRSYLLQLI